MSVSDQQSAGADDKQPKTKDEAILEEARDRRRMCESAEGDNHRNARDDLLFLTGGDNQWDAEAAIIRRRDKRMMLTVNNLPTFLNQVTNQQRMNKPAIKVHPVDDNADEETAEVLQGLIRHIEYDSNADVATYRGVNSAASIGFGYFRLVTEFESPNTFDQKIMFKSIRNALSVHIDPLSQEPDGSDMTYCFIDSVMDRKEFERCYPDAEANSVGIIGQTEYSGWFTDKTVLVCEYYRIHKKDATVCLLTDGSSGYKDELPKPLPLGISIKQERESFRPVVEWFKITGSDVLERTEIKCQWIPVFPVYGNEIDVDGRVERSGVIRNAKDPFKMYNYCITCATEEVSLRPKTPFIMAEGQDEGYQDEWANANSVSYSSLKYRPVSLGGTLAPPPQRQAMADVPMGMLAMMQHAADNKKATTGLFDASFGAKGTATSGVQEREQQAQGDVANFHYADSLNITERHVGRCLVSMIPNYYDAARTVRLLGEDNTASQAKINQPYDKKAKGGGVKTVMHDLTVGKYDVTVSAGPSFASKRQEAAEFLTAAMQAAKDPVFNQIVTYQAFKNQDVPGAEEATKMMKRAMPPNIVEAEDEDDQEPTMQTPHGPMPISQVPQLIEQMGAALQNAEKALDQAKADQVENQKKELLIKQSAEQTRHFDAETKRFEFEASAKAQQEEIAIKRMDAKTKRISAIKDALMPQSTGDGEQPSGPSIDEVTRVLSETLAEPAPIPQFMEITAPSGKTFRVEVPQDGAGEMNITAPSGQQMKVTLQ